MRLGVALLLAGCTQSGTGVLLTVDGTAAVDQLSITAAFDGRSLDQVTPAAPSGPLTLPLTLLAALPDEDTSVRFTLVGLSSGAKVSSGAAGPFAVSAHTIRSAAVSLDSLALDGGAPDGGALDLAAPADLAAPPDLAGSGYAWRKSITIDRAMVGAAAPPAALADYPLLYSVIDPALRDVAHGGHVTSASGDDVIFRADDPAQCGGAPSCQLDHELERYVPATGELIAWVHVPSLATRAASADTVLYLYYGDSHVTSPTARPANVWNSGFSGVWHFDDDVAAATKVHESTSHALDGTTAGTWTSGQRPGQIGGSLAFNGTDAYVDVANAAPLTVGAGQDFTVSLWIKSTMPPVANQYPRMVCKAYDQTPLQSISLNLHNATTAATSPWYGETFSNGVHALVQGSTDVADGNWHLLVLARSGSTLFEYQDGVSTGTSGGAGGDLSNALPLRFGAMSDPASQKQFYQGAEDEARLSLVARSADWAQTDFASQSNPALFATTGAETPAP
ncbi:MAG TPA: LamG-like jellyroll fold domain-containing protein [Polyangia bacterium]|nr:LamG-like jellyroll fold domain-containing protein [Polyangia bacterium]